MPYSTQTVPQLKELLKARGLATNGLKSELIARLEASDKSSATETKDKELLEETEPSVETKAEEEPTAAETKDEFESEETKEEPNEKVKEEPKVKILSPEERKAAALDLLNKKLARAKKFGSEEDAESVKKDIARIEKFGVEPGTALAKQLGLISKEGLTERRERRGSQGRKGRHARRHRG
jgi:SAP domain-containing ribonucleoprotein